MGLRVLRPRLHEEVSVSVDQPKLIMHVLYRLDYGGLENGLINLINHISPTHLRHAIVCMAGYTDFSSRIKLPGVGIYSLDKRPGKDPGVYQRFRRLLRSLRPDLVHTRNLGTVDLQWIALACGVRTRIHGEHGWEARDLQGSNRRHLLIRRLCRPAIQRYVAVSADIARWLQKTVGVPTERITQIYNGVDTVRFRPEGPRPADIPWRTEVDEQRLIFGTIGRLNAVKNQGSLLQTFCQLQRQAPHGQSYLIVVGDGPLATQLRQLAASLNILDRVWFTGPRDDIPDLLRAMDVFVLPSLNEGISNTLLEAMATGRPVVAANVGGNPELIEPGSCGLLYEPMDASGLQNAMNAYRENPQLRRDHGNAARRRAESRFAIETMTDRYTQLYLSMATS